MKNTHKQNKKNLKHLTKKSELEEEIIWEKYFYRALMGIVLVYIYINMMETTLRNFVILLLLSIFTIKAALNMVGIKRIEDKLKK